MKDIDNMPPKCHDCPYWEMCEEPYICPMQDEKKELKGHFKSARGGLWPPSSPTMKAGETIR